MTYKGERDILSHFFSHREENFEYASFDREMAFYESISAGNIESVRRYAEPLFCEGCGTLSKDPLRNMKYHFTVSAALIARVCIGGGMTTEDAYSLSDVYIMRADECESIEAVRETHWKMVEDYTEKMRRLQSSRVISKRVVRAVEYISGHLHSRIKIEDCAEYLSINPSYLSRLFKKEMKISFSEYVNRKKIEEATGLLRYSDYSDLEISNLFCFSSQSYFIKMFRKYMGVTPKEYKRRFRFTEIRAQEG